MERNLVTGRGQLIEAAPGSDFGIGLNEELDVGIRENNRADITSIQHDTAAFLHRTAGNPPLLGNELLADRRPLRHAACGRSYVGRTKQRGHILIIQKNTKRLIVRPDVQANRVEQFDAARLIVQALPADHRQANSTIAPTGVEVNVAKALGHQACCCTFARTGGTVDGYDHLIESAFRAVEYCTPHARLIQPATMDYR